ncbi:hypothetical protein AB8810_10920 [Xanthomonas sp. NCPPB 3005]
MSRFEKQQAVDERRTLRDIAVIAFCAALIGASTVLLLQAVFP